MKIDKDYIDVSKVSACYVDKKEILVRSGTLVPWSCDTFETIEVYNIICDGVHLKINNKEDYEKIVLEIDK